MFGQTSCLPISTHATIGEDIVTPPKSYMTIFVRLVGTDPVVPTFYAKNSDGVSSPLQSNGHNVVKS